MIRAQWRVYCDAQKPGILCLSSTTAADSPTEAAELARIGGWLKLAQDGPNDPVTHLCPICRKT